MKKFNILTSCFMLAQATYSTQPYNVQLTYAITGSVFAEFEVPVPAESLDLITRMLGEKDPERLDDLVNQFLGNEVQELVKYAPLPGEVRLEGTRFTIPCVTRGDCFVSGRQWSEIYHGRTRNCVELRLNKSGLNVQLSFILTSDDCMADAYDELQAEQRLKGKSTRVYEYEDILVEAVFYSGHHFTLDQRHFYRFFSYSFQDFDAGVPFETVFHKANLETFLARLKATQELDSLPGNLLERFTFLNSVLWDYESLRAIDLMNNGTKYRLEQRFVPAGAYDESDLWSKCGIIEFVSEEANQTCQGRSQEDEGWLQIASSHNLHPSWIQDELRNGTLKTSLQLKSFTFGPYSFALHDKSISAPDFVECFTLLLEPNKEEYVTGQTIEEQLVCFKEYLDRQIQQVLDL